MVVVSHQLEPFLALATTALTVRDGRALLRSLPAEPAARLALLEHMARGEALE